MFVSKQVCFLVCALVCAAQAFAPRSSVRLSLTLHAMVPQAPAPVVVTSDVMTTTTATTASPMQQGVESYLSRSSSMQVALQERKIPTKEEIEAKKRNFNVVFWGGGFVAPFLATIFYFGFKFWEK